MSIEMKNKKHTRTIALIFLLVLFIALIFAFKLINQATNGTSQWAQTIAGSGLIESKHINAVWFTDKGLSHFLAGPMGFKSFAQFKLVATVGTTETYSTFLLPIFWDLLINWIALVGIIFLVVSIVLSFVKENKINKILSEKGTTTAIEETKEITKEEIKQEAIELEEKLEEEIVAKQPVKKKVKKPVAKKVEEVKVEEVKVEEAKVVAKKPVAKKPAAKKVEEAKVVAKKPVAKKPAAKKVEEAKVVAKKPVAKKPAAKKVEEAKVEEAKVVAKKPAAKKPAAKKVEEAKVVAKKPVAKKPVAKKVEEVKVEETKVAATAKTESKYVIKKHYNQVSKKDLLIKLEETHSEFSKKSVKEVVDSAFEIMSNAIINNEEVLISNFGKLTKIHKEAKKGINPSTGETIDIPASNTVKFKANKHLKENMSKGKWTGLTKVKKEIKK
ncbi:predicted histone-like DNA-binding protein [Mesoplasma florum L1]|uniref:Predicted histone-like DNA-binding protein n=1 Tax=Mesoplasma florum (strain ATCC 33453 / NBRC 100688 / NCTC 11704 / L1) TaxID=265311 RepID=Q6F0E7_MESFL|nr:HU family DNA-binding protein [Mesoplasma florum]AAT76026.1 predicted histone-like DNA-binding protein [Mesoplasma florum L1]